MSPVADYNLTTFLMKAPLQPAALLSLRSWFGCLATAVHYLHSNKIRHRDIKPANILIHEDRILLVDFELAFDWKDLPHSTTTAWCGGTWFYAAPEVILHNKRNSASDIWSLGCVFLEMATVLKGRRVSDLREFLKSQADNDYVYNNEQGVSQWIEELGELDNIDIAPLNWASQMLQWDQRLRPKAAALLHLMKNFTGREDASDNYFGMCCKNMEIVLRSSTGFCSSCRTTLAKV